ncbi:MAG: hypothetical protein Q8S13_07035 [Dehalococcoidia bacterium]|nr:hypothetical protein [Dehalococcoidia bacterium]
MFGRKGGRRSLRGGTPRIYADHRTSNAIIFRRHLAGLRQRYGIVDRIAADYAAGTAAAYASWHLVTGLLVATEQLRATGKGRRPSSQAVERLRRRQGLEWKKYESALKRLEELTAKNRKPKSLAEELDRQAGSGEPR